MTAAFVDGLRVGEVAERSGMTVRTLHHYDQLGLVRPNARTSGGHRLYSAEDVERLYIVSGLRELGLGLERIAEVLRGALTVGEMLEYQQDALDRKIAALMRARDRIRYARRLDGIPDLLELIKEVTMTNVFEDYFSEEQILQLQQRRVEIGEDAIAEGERAWPELIARVEDAIARGVDPRGQEGAALAREWFGLLEAFHGGDPGLKESLFRMYAENRDMIEAEHEGPSAAAMEFISAAEQSMS